MSDSATQTFSNIDSGRWQRIKDAVKTKADIAINSDTGDASEKGVKLGWVYNASAGTLSITLEGRAWYDPSAATLEADIKAWIDGTP